MSILSSRLSEATLPAESSLAWCSARYLDWLYQPLLLVENALADVIDDLGIATVRGRLRATVAEDYQGLHEGMGLGLIALLMGNGDFRGGVDIRKRFLALLCVQIGAGSSIVALGVLHKIAGEKRAGDFGDGDSAHSFQEHTITGLILQECYDIFRYSSNIR